jgi:hypothetical protein
MEVSAVQLHQCQLAQPEFKSYTLALIKLQLMLTDIDATDPTRMNNMVNYF